MKPLVFNKEVTSKRQGNEPSVIFRKLPDTGNNNRYQGNINSTGQELIKDSFDGQSGLKIEFSDQHSIVGFKPDSDGVRWAFGATQLFKALNLVIGKRYKLVVNGDYIVFDSDQYHE